MHGQKRSEYKSRLLDPETSAKLATKAQQWNHLSSELLTQRRRLFGPPSRPPRLDGCTSGGGNNDDEGGTKAASPGVLLALTEKMLSVNPDPSHLWNIRREMLLYSPSDPRTEDPTDGSDPTKSSTSIDIKAELTLTAHCLQRNPKAYSSWFHRKWSLVHFLKNPPTAGTDETDGDGDSPEKTEALCTQKHLIKMKAILQSELELCAQFLQMDERNFHCWNYRRFVVAVLGSCGGGSASTANIAAESDADLLTGSWSLWLGQSKVSMGAQLSRGATTAKGILSSNPAEQSETSSNIAKHTTPLSKEELEEIIMGEWNFTTSKIRDNFSNGSAFHYRSKLLPLMLETRLSSGSDGEGENGDIPSPSESERYEAILSLARDEWESILLNAIFTEPDDQTPWWYHRFLISWSKPSADLDDTEMKEEYDGLLFEMADSLRELLEVEREDGVSGDSAGDGGSKHESKGAKCKWAYVGLHLVLSTLLESDAAKGEEAEELREEARECLEELMRIDPNRRERYQMLAAEAGGNRG